MDVSLLFLIIVVTAVIAVIYRVTRLMTRSTPVLTEPRCVMCDYDLRAASFINGPPTKCPECGDDLSLPGAVRFGKYITPRRRPALIAAGIAVGIFAALILLFYLRSR